ncbi:MAG: hypothetical protein WCW52_02265 [Elusimicrobiales bacterium]|jgi:hypothetical protein
MVRKKFLVSIVLFIVLVLLTLCFYNKKLDSGMLSFYPHPKTAHSPQNLVLTPVSENIPQVDTKVPAYEKYLQTLNPISPESILAARNNYLTEFENGADLHGEGFRTFRKFYENVVQEFDYVFHKDRDSQVLLNELSRIIKNYNGDPLDKFAEMHTADAEKIRSQSAIALRKLEEYHRCGIGFYYGEGEWYLQMNLDFLLATASGVSAALLDYIKFYVTEHRETIAGDASLGITWEELRRRIIRFEKFAESHAQLPEIQNEVNPELHELVSVYLYGLDNTRAYNLYYGEGDGLIDQSLKTSYEIFLKKNKNSGFYPLINGVYAILEKHEFRISPEQLTFMFSQDYEDVAVARLLESGK